MTRAASYLTVGLGLSLLIANAAQAAGTALVEDASNPHPGLEAMDTLSTGQMISLRDGERLVINYLASCTRETIVGGVVKIGTDASTVVGGKVTREKVECNGGKAQLTNEQASKSGVMVFRGIKLHSATDATKTN